jgi:hypothetical protein
MAKMNIMCFGNELITIPIEVVGVRGVGIGEGMRVCGGGGV